MAITEILGKRRRSTERNSNPDMFGMFRSDVIRSGVMPRNCKRASNPSVATLTVYPAVMNNIERLSRMIGSSSTTRMWRLAERVDTGEQPQEASTHGRSNDESRTVAKGRMGILAIPGTVG